MIDCEPLSTIESQIRGAVATGAYEEATILLSSYSKQLETHLRGNSPRYDRLAEEIVHTNEFLGWIFRMVSAARAHDAARLVELLSVSPYRGSGANQVHSWGLEG
jgi:hypothetical protein